MSEEVQTEEAKNDSSDDSKSRLDKMQSDMNELTNVLYSFVNYEKDKNMNANEDQKQIQSDDIEDLGFNDKQLEFINRRTDQAVSKALETYDGKKADAGEKERMDNEAYAIYDDLNNENSLFHKETKRVIQERINRGRTEAEKQRIKDQPDLILSSAAIVHAKMQKIKKQQEQTTDSEKNNNQKRYRNEVSFMSSPSSSRVKNDKSDDNVSEERLAIRRMFGS